MRKSINIILKKNILIILLMISMCPVLGFSYARFVINTDSYRSNEMYMAELLYTVKIDDVSTYTLTLEAGAYEEEHIIEITSIDMIGSNYKLIYQDNGNVKVEYASDYQDPAFGGILTKRTIMLRLTNNTDVNQTLSFSVIGGYSFNSLDEIDTPEGYTEVNLEYWKYDYETMALYIDNVRVDSLDENKYYALVNYTCNRDIEVLYNVQNRTITLNSDTQTKCSLYFNEFNPTFTFDYTGSSQLFNVEIPGYYKIELWGAQGGSVTSTYIGGYGAYSYGSIYLEKGKNLYIYVAGEGIGSNNNIKITGGYNGGGNGTGSTCSGISVRYGASGGGSTHIATSSGLLSTLKNDTTSIIIVAGGGGGSFYFSEASGNGAHAGGYIGNTATWTNASHQYYVQATGGSQTSGGLGGNSYASNRSASGSFGQGANFNGGSCDEGSGGGSGYYGGGAGSFSPGAGGSGYIGNSLLTNKAMYCYDCSTSDDESTKTISNTCVNSTPTEKCSKTGNGYARITYLGTSI